MTEVSVEPFFANLRVLSFSLKLLLNFKESFFNYLNLGEKVADWRFSLAVSAYWKHSIEVTVSCVSILKHLVFHRKCKETLVILLCFPYSKNACVLLLSGRWAASHHQLKRSDYQTLGYEKVLWWRRHLCESGYFFKINFRLKIFLVLK